MNTLVTIFKYINQLGAFATIGSLLTMGFLLLDTEGKLSTSSEKLRKFFRISVAIWVVGIFGTILFTLAQILDSSIRDVFDVTVLRSFLTQFTLGKYLAFEAVIALTIFFASFIVKKILSILVLFILAIIGLTGSIFESHATSGGSHSLVIGSLVIHVIALSLWVGGIFSMAFLSPADRPIAVPRFSQLALWAAIAVVISGTVNAWTRLNFMEALNSAYVLVVATKVFATILLIGIGYLHRQNLQNKSQINWVGFGKLLSAEAMIMVVTVAMGAWLSTNSAPDRPGTQEFNAAISVTGVTTPPPPSLKNLFFSYEPDALVIGVLIFMIALYIKGVLILTKRGDKWPMGRTVAFALGVSALDFATSGGLGLYSKFSFSYHMIAHMVIGMIAPIAIVLSAPLTLALRTLPQARVPSERGVRGTLLTVLHSRYGIFMTNPITALVIFDGSLFALYFTDLFATMMQSHVGHLFMTLHFFGAGYLFFSIIIGVDPNPRKIPHLVRIIILFTAMSIHAFFSIALMSASNLIDQGYFASLKTDWLVDLLADQKLGGSIGWAMGEIPILLALVATFIQWMRDDSREGKRIDKNTARMAAMGEPDELANYNKYLQELAQRDKNGS